MKKFYYLFLVLGLISCASKSPIALQWEVVQNDIEPGIVAVNLTMTNLTNKTFEGDWTLWFNLMSLGPSYTEGDPLKQTRIQGSWQNIRPTEAFEPLQPKESRVFPMRFRGSAIRENVIPEGFFLIWGEDSQPVSVECTYVKYTRAEQMKRGIETWEKTPYADGEYVYQYIDHILTADSNAAESILPLLPQPKKVVIGEGTCDATTATVIERVNANMIEEGYALRILADTILMEANDERGIYYAHRTLRQLRANMDEHALPQLHIIDWPDLHHRGLMLDIVRNYYPLDSILRVVDVMADYKLNTLHLHISDDEGWRLEIPGLPELTDNASRRGWTLDESDCLWPMYCGGWNKNDKTSMANGYMTRDEYIRLLQYCKERAIRVIPEIDMPGHMRACKKAMHGLLTDSVLEARVYNSAQNYTDNVIAVSNPYAIEFIDKVITEIVKMHEDAGCPMEIFNIGGDEVPAGSLTKEEHQAYIDAVIEILNRYHLQPMGWEEITHFCAPETRAICYSWHNGDAKPREMAEAGYPVVLAAANHLYFDFAYCKHHEEKGLDWGGFTDEYRAFDWQPLEHANVVGMNGQLWAEVLRSFSQAEWQLFPKTFGLSERSWNMHSPLSLAQYNDLVYTYALRDLHQGGHTFHLQQPGIHVEGDMVSINRVMQDGITLYTLDDETWNEYTEPFMIDTAAVKTIKAKVQYLGQESNTTWLWR